MINGGILIIDQVEIPKKNLFLLYLIASGLKSKKSSLSSFV
jgi:hypothetical protein